MKKEEKLQLIFVLKVGENHKREGIYEFMFSSNIDELDIDDWEWNEKPAKDFAQIPEEGYYDKVLRVETSKVKFHVLHESEHFAYIDGYDNVIALAWESLEEEEIDSDNLNPVLYDDAKRMVFHYGNTLKDVEDKFYARDIIIK
ncbi:MAG: hypothetical protein ACOC33_02285 [bacterium]